MAKSGNQGDGGGRKFKELTPEQMSQIEGLASVLSQDQMADYFGITRPTFAAMRDRDPEVALRYQRGRAKAIGSIGNGLLQQAQDGNMTAAIFYLKTQAGWTERQAIEHTGAEGAPLLSVADILGPRIDAIKSRAISPPQPE